MDTEELETPKSRRCRPPRHVPTPKMSERKRSLFQQNSNSPATINEDSDSDLCLSDFSPLQFSCSPTNNDKEITITKGKNSKQIHRRISFKNAIKELNVNNKDSDDINSRILSDVTTKVISENVEFSSKLEDEVFLKTPSSEQTQNNNMPRISFRKSGILSDRQTPSSCTENISPNQKKMINKRKNTLQSYTDSPKSKMQKLDVKTLENPKVRTSLSFESFIPTKSFYSNTTSAETYPIKKRTSDVFLDNNKVENKHINKRNLIRSERKKFAINKGVCHGIIKRKLNTKRYLRKKNFSSTLLQSSIDLFQKSKILKNSSTTITHDDDTQITPDQVQRINSIIKNMKNPIEMAKPLTLNHNSDFSDDNDEDSDENNETNKINGKENEIELTKKKFFKSGNSVVKNKYLIINNLAATINHGKLSLIPEKKKRKRKTPMFNDDGDFEADHKELDGIINKLQSNITDEEDNLIKSTNNNLMKYYNQIPYNTNDPEKIQSQRNLLEFLVTNDICNDENFKIFIQEPEKYKNEAAAITDQFFIIDTTQLEFNDQNVVNNVDVIIQDHSNINDVPMSPTSQISNMTSELVLECQTEGNVAEKKKMFHIFSKDFMQPIDINAKSTLKENKKIWRPIGINQYQIDAGQKKFGAVECKDCGLIYSVHEPEDEILHQQFHNSAEILKFKGWTDERVVTDIIEWGVLGRIITVSLYDSKAKINRMNEVLKIVDNELGFSKIILDPNCLIYLAIGKNVIMGICVAQPQKYGHKFIEENDTELCTEKTYPIKCGISRIWVASPYRRQGVARHLINAVRSNFIFGHCLTYDELAFGSPTDDGKKLAKKLTNRSDFLVYV